MYYILNMLKKHIGYKIFIYFCKNIAHSSAFNLDIHTKNGIDILVAI